MTCLIIAASAASAATSATATATTIVLDPSVRGQRFDGVGGVSGGGGGTRLLYDYPEPQRSDILDFLFLPGFGASLQVLKVEIGADGDTTQGSEQSHMRSADDASPTAFDRGYETWLMVEAKRRNPDIALSGLIWGVPGWVAAGAAGGGLFTPANVAYQLAWLRGLRSRRNLTVDSIGVGYNENAFNATFIKAFRAALGADAALASTVTIAADQCCGSEYDIVAAMAKDPELRAAVDVVGTHCPGPINGQKLPPPAAVAPGHKPLWDTEQHFGLPDPSPAKAWDWAAAAALATTLNQNYVTNNHTSTQMWTPIYSWYGWLNYPGKGLMVANTPWSGWYNVTAPVWVAAHTTHFTKLGWSYLGGGACRMLPLGGSVVGLVPPAAAAQELTVVVETMGATGAQTLRFDTASAANAAASAANTPLPLALWTTSEPRVAAATVFVARGALANGTALPGGGRVDAVTAGGFTLTVPAGQLWTVSSVRPPAGGRAAGGRAAPPPVPQDVAFSTLLPLRDDFDDAAAVPEDTLPRYFSDMHGAFSVFSEEGDDGGARNRVLRQQAPTRPHSTHGRSSAVFGTAIGDPSWSNYTVGVRAMVEDMAGKNASRQFVRLGSHAGAGPVSPSAMHGQAVAIDGWTLELVVGGSWSLVAGSKAQLLASGADGFGDWAAGEWLSIELGVAVPAAAEAEGEGEGAATTSRCDGGAAQRWAFDASRGGQLCNGAGACLNVPNCDVARPLIFFRSSFPGASCVARCGCTPRPGHACGLADDTHVDCNTNAEWAWSASTSQLVSAIDAGGPPRSCAFERGDGSVALRGCNASGGGATPAAGGGRVGAGGDEQDLWLYDAKAKTLTNSHSGHCLGGPSAGPAPGPGGGTVVTATVNGRQLCRVVDSDGSAGRRRPVGAAFLGCGVHYARFDDFAVTPNAAAAATADSSATAIHK